jgi:mono/diheme cytochrome c family protein
MPKKSLYTLAGVLSLSVFSAQAHAHGGHHDPSSHDHADMSQHWMAPAKQAKRRNPIKANPASLERGEALYQEYCASCHGPQGAGDGPAAEALNPKPANLKEMAPYHSDGDLAWKIAQGRGAMPGWKRQLRARQIWDIVNFIKHIPKPD